MKGAALALVLAACMATAAAGQVGLGDFPNISVTGEAVVYAQPDKIVINLGIETMDKDILLAKQKNNEIMKKTIAALKESGVPEKGIQTEQLSIEPRWHDNYLQDEFIGYFVRNTLAVTVTDAARVEGVITSALQAGVNRIHGVEFQTTALKELRDQARELALNAAQEKAEKMAEVLEQTIDRPVQINERPAASYYSGASRWGGGRSGGMSQNVMQDVRGDVGEAGETIALGKIAIRASVDVTFSLE